MKRASARHIIFLLCALICMSCAKDIRSRMTGYGECATVNLFFNAGTQTGHPDVRSGEAGPDEGIKTIRVIIASWEGDDITIVRNEKRIYNDNSTVRAMTIFDIPEGQYTFYVIANEESLGKTYDDATFVADIRNVDTGAGRIRKKLLYSDTDNSWFPAAWNDIGTNGLPIAGMQEVSVSRDMGPVRIDIERCVAKVNLSITNSTASELDIARIDFGQFFGNQFYMFRELTLDIPESITYTSYSKTVDRTVLPNGGVTEFSFYLYPSFAFRSGVNNPYRIGLVAKNSSGQALSYEMTGIVSASTGQMINSIARNTQLNIRANISTLTNIAIDFTVTDWYRKDIDVPSFN